MVARIVSRTVTGIAFVLALLQAPSSIADEPVWDGQRWVYPEGGAVPRGLTPREREILLRHPPQAQRGTPTAPTGPVHCVAEYEPMEGLLIAWEGPSSWLSILNQIAAQVTTIGNADVYVVVDSTSERSSAQSILAAGGADMNRVRFVVRTTDTIWIRDYGPRYIYEGPCRAIVDHTYNRPRPNDDAFPAYFAAVKNHARYQIPLVHGGGNFHLDAVGRSYTTRLINNENPALTETEIHDLWQTFQNVDSTFFNPFPTSVDSTQHIDMWTQVVADNAAVISDWPANAGSIQDQICDGAAALLAARGITVYRVPARSVGGVHYTYTNVVLCNDLVLVPIYSNAQVAPHNPEALATWQSALPDKAVVPINSDAIVTSAGVLHCIVMHVPLPPGGASPTTYLKTLRGGEVLEPGSQVEVRWISDDDRGVTSVDLLLSTDAGNTFPTTIVTGTNDDGSYLWTVPDLPTTRGRVRVVVHDADAHSGHDQSDFDLTITGSPSCPGDLNADGRVDLVDLGVLLSSFGIDGGGDLDHDGDTDLADLGILLANYGRVCP